MRRHTGAALAAVATLALVACAQSVSIAGLPDGVSMLPAPLTQFVQLSQAAKAPSHDKRSIDGKIKINGELYNVVCDCSKNWKEHVAEQTNATAPRCSTPSKFRIQRVGGPRSSKFDAQAVRQFLGLPSELQYVTVGEQFLSGFDNRGATPLLGAVGGDMGEFILMLAQYAAARGSNVTEKDAGAYFSRYLQATGTRPFYLHSSSAAVSALEEEMEVEGLNLAAPRDEEKAQLLGSCPGNRKPPCGVMAPDGVGDTHLKLMLQKPSLYFVNPELVRAAIHAFYSTLWDAGNPLSKRVRFSVTPSSTAHPEQAVIFLRVSEGCRRDLRSPVVPPRHMGSDVAVYLVHTDAVQARRLEMAKFFSRLDASHHVDARQLMQSANRAAARMEGQTLRRVAKDMPIYEAQVM